jgi:hypothetical protein
MKRQFLFCLCLSLYLSEFKCDLAPLTYQNNVKSNNIYLIDESLMDFETSWNLSLHLKHFISNINNMYSEKQFMVTNLEEGIEIEVKKAIKRLENIKKANMKELNNDLRQFYNLYIFTKQFDDADISSSVEDAEKNGISIYIIYVKSYQNFLSDKQKNVFIHLEGDYSEKLFSFIINTQFSKNTFTINNNKTIQDEKADFHHGIWDDAGQIALWFLLLIIIGPSILVVAFVLILCKYCCRGGHH